MSELRPFSEWITDHAQGHADDLMTCAMAEVAQAVSGLGKKGSVNLKVTIEPADQAGRQVITRITVDAKPPLPDPEASIFYPDEMGGLHRHDPFQQRADFGDARTIDTDTGEIQTLPEGD